MSANLTDARLKNANLTGAVLVNATLTGANLENANLTGAGLPNATLAGANLNSANLTGAELYHVNLTRANLHSANLTGAWLRSATLTGARLYNATLTGANLNSANLTDMKLGDTFIVRNYAKILFFKLFNVKKIGFECERLTGESKWNYTKRYFFSNLYFLFIQWNFRPDFKDAKYDKSTTLPKWLDPEKSGMIKVPKEPEAPNVSHRGKT